MMTKPTKWEWQSCKCGCNKRVALCEGAGIHVKCAMCGKDVPRNEFIQGSAPPFVPMSEKRFPVYGKEENI